MKGERFFVCYFAPCHLVRPPDHCLTGLAMGSLRGKQLMWRLLF
jgi:hypothetical protein